MKKTTWIAILFLLFISIIGARTLPRRDLRATAQVAGIAIDQGENGLVATFEIYDANVDETIGAKRKTAVSRGGSIEECIVNSLYTYGKELFVNDASVLVIGEENCEGILKKVLDFYRLYQNDRMDLPIFFANGKAGAIFKNEGSVISMELAESARQLGRIQTIKDLMNGSGERVFLKGDGNYEIQK